MNQTDRKQLSILTKRLSDGLKKNEVFVENGINDTDKESVARFQLQPGWAAALILMSELMVVRSPIRHDYTAEASSVWSLLEEAQCFLKISAVR